ncbi:MAG TPA: ABC transporter permease, partial [Acidimicrobiaceae bacterium]|nr:ABC transporter permease [Acidimicrobiaceae bacterium]
MTARQKQMLYVGAALIVVMAWTFYTADGPQTTAVLAGTVRAATLLALGAMCGMIGERSGVVNIGIEGQFLLSAFVAFTIASMTGSLFLGTVAGVGMGLIMGWMLAAMAVGLKVDQ